MMEALDLLEGLLNSPPRIIFTYRDTFTGKVAGSEKIVTHRYIRILRGRLIYLVDGLKAKLEEGAIFFVPKGARRSWEVPRGEVCEILWCEFETPGLRPDPHCLYHADDSRQKTELAALKRLAAYWKFPRHLRAGVHGDPAVPRATALLMEGELKASMARFWTRAKPWGRGGGKQKPREKKVHPGVKAALAWMEEHYRRSDAQKVLFREVVPMSPNHFRLLFLREAGKSVSAHLLCLRMQEAMNQLRTGTLSIKEISAQVGFEDPLYFSRRFREHWDITPTAVRK